MKRLVRIGSVVLVVTVVIVYSAVLVASSGAQGIMATPVPPSPTPDIPSEIVAALVRQIIAILQAIIADLV